jgi:hypothetical protein
MAGRYCPGSQDEAGKAYLHTFPSREEEDRKGAGLDGGRRRKGGAAKDRKGHPIDRRLLLSSFH